MKTPYLKKFALGATAGFGFGMAILVVGIAYATYSGLAASTSETLTKDKWNEMLQYTVPPGAVMAFNLTSCPTNWSEADGGGWRPNLRGQFIRGLNSTAVGLDANRSLASAQSHMIVSHKHAGWGFNDGAKFKWWVSGYSNVGDAIATYGWGTWWMEWWSDAHAIGATSTNPASQVIWGNETRPTNVALLYCVKD